MLQDPLMVQQNDTVFPPGWPSTSIWCFYNAL